MPASTRHCKTFKMAKNKRKQISFHSSKYISHLQLQSFYFHRAHTKYAVYCKSCEENHPIPLGPLPNLIWQSDCTIYFTTFAWIKSIRFINHWADYHIICLIQATKSVTAITITAITVTQLNVT